MLVLQLSLDALVRVLWASTRLLRVQQVRLPSLWRRPQHVQGAQVSLPSYHTPLGLVADMSLCRFMDLDQYELGYFISQVGLAAASFGVSQSDISTVATALQKLFGYKCSPPSTVVPGDTVLDSICINPSCPLDPMPTCAAYPSGGTGTPPATCSMTASSTPSMSKSRSTYPTSTMTCLPPTMKTCPHETATKTKWCYATETHWHNQKKEYEWNCHW